MNSNVEDYIYYDNNATSCINNENNIQNQKFLIKSKNFFSIKKSISNKKRFKKSFKYRYENKSKQQQHHQQIMIDNTNCGHDDDDDDDDDGQNKLFIQHQILPPLTPQNQQHQKQQQQQQQQENQQKINKTYSNDCDDSNSSKNLMIFINYNNSNVNNNNNNSNINNSNRYKSNLNQTCDDYDQLFNSINNSHITSYKNYSNNDMQNNQNIYNYEQIIDNDDSLNNNNNNNNTINNFNNNLCALRNYLYRINSKFLLIIYSMRFLHIYLLTMFLFSLFTMPNAYGFNVINNQTIYQQTQLLLQPHQTKQQQLHHLTSSSSATLKSSSSSSSATSTSIDGNQHNILSPELSSTLSSSSSSSLSPSTSALTSSELISLSERSIGSTSLSLSPSSAVVAAADATVTSENLQNHQHLHSTILQLQHQQQQQQHHSREILNNNNDNNNGYTIRREPNLSYTSGGCHTCQMREQAKLDNLASIKKHILMRLKLDIMPNITAPVVPREIIEKFYKNNSNSINKNNYGRYRNRDGSDYYDGGHSRSYDSMQGDDPRIYSENYDYGQSSHDDDDDELEEQFYSVVNSIFVFPTVSRMRHNRKPEILHFAFTNNEHSTVSKATLHVYIRGRDWIREYEPSVLNNSNDNLRKEIILTINRVIRRQNSPNSTHTQKVTEIRQIIPNGLGTWITIDVTNMVSTWYNNPSTNFGVVIKSPESWMRNVIVTEDSSKSKTLYIEVQTKNNRKRRSKRDTSLNCSESDNEVRCCRYPLKVEFSKFNWDWIIAPSSFEAYFCNGECKLGFLQRYPHTHIMQLSTAPQPCCSPTKMSPIDLLYFSSEKQIVRSTIPNMSVEKCSCS